MNPGESRRDFLRLGTIAGVAGSVLATASPARAHFRRPPPSERIRFACIGVGGKGDSDSSDAGTHGEVVAICDVDEKTLARKGEQFPAAKRYFDYRTMLAEMGDQIDAVTVSTPDHTHAPAAVMAMRMGKHCFCQKPLTWSIEEARVMRELAAEKKLCTQMGNQGTASDGLREGVEVIRSGALGAVKEVHVWTNRPIWPQGIPRPKETPGIPRTLHWYEWLGPAPDRPYHPAYHPFNWRGFLDFGTGALGDMACHMVNLPALALGLFDPLSVELVESAGIVDNETFPAWSIVRYQFGARGDRPPLSLTWYDGGDRLPDDRKAYRSFFEGESTREGGLVVAGSEGVLRSGGDTGAGYVLRPQARFQDFKKPERSLPCSPGHFTEFAEAIQAGDPSRALSNFDYAGRLTETVLLGVLAQRTGQKIEWDSAAMQATDCPAAEAIIRRAYRPGYSIHA